MNDPKDQLDHVIHDQLVSKLPRYYTSRILKEDMRRQNIRMYERGVINDFVGKELYDKIICISIYKTNKYNLKITFLRHNVCTLITV